MERALRIQRRLLFVLLGSFFLLVFLGGVVRSTGAGMGCPDWPRCYDKWLPPISHQDLPPNYQVIFLNKRQDDVRQLAAGLRWIGLQGLAQRLLTHKATQNNESFNLFKAWIEYVNRLLGVWVGFLSLASCVYALFCTRGKYPRTFTYLLLACFLIVIQGLLGAIVVMTHLLPTLVTLHMLLPFIILLCLLRALSPLVRWQDTVQLPKQLQRRFDWLYWLGLTLFFLQVLLGTQLRERVDTLLATAQEKALILPHLGTAFSLHSIVGWLPLSLHFFLVYYCRKEGIRGSLYLYAVGLAGGYLFQMLLGVCLYYLALPPSLQPLHLLLPFFLLTLYLLLGERLTMARKALSTTEKSLKVH